MKNPKARKRERRPRHELDETQALPTSATTVGTIPELVQYILLELDFHTLLVSASCVCRLWNELITASASIQQRLLRMDLLLIERSKPRWATEIPTDIHPLLLWAFAPLFYPNRWSVGWSYRDYVHPATNSTIVTVNELLQSHLPIADCGDRRRRHHAFTRTGASWRHIPVSNQPRVNICYERVASALRFGAAQHQDFCFPEGLRMGQLVSDKSEVDFLLR